jgi:hypothetical protein
MTEMEILEDALASSDLLIVMLKRALRQQLLEQPDRRAEVIIDISDLNIPDASETTRFFLDAEEELDME